MLIYNRFLLLLWIGLDFLGDNQKYVSKLDDKCVAKNSLEVNDRTIRTIQPGRKIAWIIQTPHFGLTSVSLSRSVAFVPETRRTSSALKEKRHLLSQPAARIQA